MKIKIGCIVQVDETDDPIKALIEAKKFVELSSKTVTQKIEKCKYVIKHPEDFTGREVAEAKTFLDQFDIAVQALLNIENKKGV